MLIACQLARRMLRLQSVKLRTATQAQPPVRTISLNAYIYVHTHTHIYCFPTVVGLIDFELAIDPNQEQMAVCALVVHLSVLNSNNEEAAVCVCIEATLVSAESSSPAAAA